MTLTTEQAQAARPRRAPLGALVLGYLARFDDGEVLRWAFRGLLIGTIGVLASDLYDLAGRDRLAAALNDDTPQVVLPPAVEMEGPQAPADPRPNLTLGAEALSQPMHFELNAGGVLAAAGTIEPGTAAQLARELDQRGEYVRTLSLNSPGGSVADALEMARDVRKRGIATEVADGALCASSCPLLFAGGKVRRAGPKAAIGVHQIYAAAREAPRPEQAMADAQATTARISRHLAEMGVDPALWLHALDTPPRALYYLSAKELAAYRLTTPPAATARTR